MFDANAAFAGISLHVDPINRSRSESDDNVMAMSYEEQLFMWEFVRDEVKRTIDGTVGEIDFLDVGTGSGVWSILVTTHTAARHILAIDKNIRAITSEVASAYPELYFCDGIIRRDGHGDTRVVEHNIDLHGRTWRDRILLHNEITTHS